MIERTAGIESGTVLAPFGGEKSAPAWFEEAVGVPYEVVPLEFEGVALELLCWGEVGRPGLLLLHGNNAHARWWSPIAAQLASEFRVAALSWSGMGGSGWRPTYSVAAYAEEAMAAAEAAGLFAASPPVFVGHSFGGSGALEAAMRHGDRLAAVILADSLLAPMAGKPVLRVKEAHRVYPSMKEALARFRLAPAQPCANLFYLDWIARHSLKPVKANELHGPGWTWRIDPLLWERLEWHDKWSAFAHSRCPLAVLAGSSSRIVLPEHIALLQAQAPSGTYFETIADAGHHLLLDQPRQVTNAIARIARRMIG